MKICFVDNECIEENEYSQTVQGVALTPELWREVQPVINWLSDRDRDILALCCLAGKSQMDVARILGIGQVLVNYHLQRLKKHIAFVLYLHSVFDIFIDWLETRSHKLPPVMVEALVAFYYTTCYTHAATVVGYKKHVTVAQRVRRAVKRLHQLREWEVYEIFSNIQNNKLAVRRELSNCCKAQHN